MSTSSFSDQGLTVSANLTDVSSDPDGNRHLAGGRMLGFIGGGPWLFDHLAAFGVTGIAFGDGITSRALGNVIAVDMPVEIAKDTPAKEVSTEEEAKIIELIDTMTWGLPIKRFVSINEIGTLAAAQLNEQRGLGGVSPRAVVAARDKAEMRRCLEGTPLAWPYFVGQDTITDPNPIAEVVGLPCIVKPRSLTGSKGVKLLKNIDELGKYTTIAKVKSLLEKVIFEKYIDGKEYSVEAFTLDGKTRIYSVVEKNNVDAVEFDFGFSREILDQHGAACKEALDMLLACLEVRTGPTHTEVKIGPDGAVRIIETHTRVAGGYIPEIVRATIGVDLYALTVQEGCGELHSLPEPEDRQIAAAMKYRRHKAGKVISVRGEHYLRFRPDILASAVKSKPGVKLQTPESNFDRADFIACHAPTLREAYARCDHYLERLCVTIS